MFVFRPIAIKELIEKALRGSVRDDHDYIYRRPIAEKKSGKSIRRYEYIYEKDRQFRPIEMLKKFFGIGQKELDVSYEKNNIKKDFNADKKTFAQHLLEYFSHRSAWDRKFAPKEKQEKFDKPVKMATFKETKVIDKDMETPAPENDQLELFSAKEIKVKKEPEWKANPYLMRRIWGMFTGKTIEQREKEKVVAEKVIETPTSITETKVTETISDVTGKKKGSEKKPENYYKVGLGVAVNPNYETNKKILDDVYATHYEAYKNAYEKQLEALKPSINSLKLRLDGETKITDYAKFDFVTSTLNDMADSRVSIGDFDIKQFKEQVESKARQDVLREMLGEYTKTKEDAAKKLEALINKINAENADIAAKTGLITENKPKTKDRKPTKAQLLKDTIKPQLMDMGIIPHSQIVATNTEQIDNVTALIETINQMPRLGEGTHEAKLHYFVGGRDYYITELGDNGEAYGYVDVNGDPQMSEWGYLDLKELCASDINPLNPVNIDYFFKPGLVGDLIKKNGHKELYEHYSDMFGEEEEKQKAEIEKESEAEKHKNRSDAMLGNQNAKKYGLSDSNYNVIANYMRECFAKDMNKEQTVKYVTSDNNLTHRLLVQGYKNSDMAIDKIANEIYNNIIGDGDNEQTDNRTGSDRLSDSAGNLRSGTGEGNSNSDVLETESALDGDSFVQQPRGSGIGSGITETNERAAGNGRVTKGTAKQIRAKCLELLASKSDSEMTADDKALLAQYEGGGGLNEGGQSTKAVLTEFYTPRDVISKVWQIVDKYNPNKNKKVLEPSSGIGRFAEGRDEDFTLCELDETSARIAGILHPDAKVKQGAFQKLFMQNNAVTGYKGEQFDVAIGNPPYGAYNDLYKGLGEGKQHTRYEEYFIDRSLDTLKDGGILAFVVPSSFLRGKDGKGKESIAKKGKLLEAWRLPKGTFSSTDVGTDIIVIRKGKGDIADYCNNKYFDENESHVIGHESEGKDRFGKPTKIVNLPEGKTVEEAIQMIDVGESIPTATDNTDRVKEAAKNVEAKEITPDPAKMFTVIGNLEIGAKLIRPDGANGEITGISGGMISYKFDSKNNPFGRQSIDDFAVADDKETVEEIRRNRSEAMKGNKNAEKAIKKEVVKKATSGDIYTPSAGENMTAAEFNAKYSKEIPEADMKFWRVTDWEGKVDTTRLTDAEIKELENNKDFVKDENGNYVNVANYASGNIVEKLETLKANKDKMDPQEYERKKAILEAVLPARRNVMQFTVSPLENFATQVTIDEDGISLKDKFLMWCGFNEAGNIPYGRRSPIPKSELADNMTMRDIWEYINQVPVRAERARRPEDKETAKMFAEEKKNARRETTERLFNKWLRELPESQQKIIEDEWNYRFNSRVNPDYKKIPLFVEGMNTHKGKKPFELKEQQIKGISMLCNKGNGILAYDVGVGKTACGIVATVNQAQTGASKCPMICVPKSVYKKWIKEIKQHFPDMPINELGNFSEKDLGKFRKDGKIDLPEGALNICTYEALQKITFKEETLNGELRDDMLDSQSIYDYDENGNLIEDTRSEREKAQAEERLMKLLGKSAEAKEGAVYWEDLGIDHITVDELHNFKNVFSIPRTYGKSVRSTNEAKTDYWGHKIKADDDPGALSNEYSGLQGASSSRAMKLFAISQLIQRETDGRGFFGLSATPFNNSPVEIYNILSLVARNRLKELQIYNLQDFMRQYAELKPDWKVKANGEVESAQTMKNFKNLPALQNLITEYIDKVDGEEAGVIRPYKRIHKPQLDLTPLQRAIIKAETDRMDGKFAKPGDENKQSADALIAMNNMRMATLSPTLIDPKFWADYAEYEGWHEPKRSDIVKESPKLQFVCDTASKQYKDRPNAGQVIYMPRGVEDYSFVKDYLVSKGVPADAIAFMDSSTSLDKKEKIKDEFNDVDGKIKIIIGSETIKEGVSLNGNATTIYNTMLGWNPTETIQVEGRVWRQGNKQGVTHIVYPLMNDSIDAMMYQKYDEKSSRLNALWSYKGDSLNVEDINPEELKFELIKDPAKRASMKIKKEQADLKKQKKMQDALYDTIYEQRAERERLQQTIERQTKEIPDYEKTITDYQKRVEDTEKAIKEAKKAKEDTWSLDRRLSDYKYSLNSYKSMLRNAEKAIKESNERIGAIENSWKKQGIDTPDQVESKLEDISAKRRETERQIGDIEARRNDYIFEAKKQIEEEQRKQTHYSVEDRVNYYADEIGKDLRSFDNVKTGREALKKYTPDQINVLIENIKQNGSVKVADDTLNARDLRELETLAKKNVVAKAIIYKGRLLVRTTC